MNLKDCYIKFGGDFDEVLGRLRREQSVQKFMYKFLDDKSFHLFEASMENKDYEEALRAVPYHSKEFVKIFHLPDCLKVVVW